MPKNILEMIGIERDERVGKPVGDSYSQSAFLDPSSQALEGSALDPLSLLGGGKAAEGVMRGAHAGDKALKKYFANAKKYTGKVKDPSKRVANLALAGGTAKIADPTFIPSALADAVGLGVKQPNMLDVAQTLSKATSKFAVNASRFKNYRLNKVAGLSDEQALALDTIARVKLAASKPGNIVSKFARANDVRKDVLRSDVKDVAKLAYDLSSKL